ncbi:precorrin-3B C(17)-methyltransferase [Cytobacillus sp. IB215665]|uniref:precorrin-3B C(17)-methyltransferase n=1 Tax=Cytobacillus sp. IB215665 TaxID=3097357 RepID=UPI002A0EA228|nr:precorrin-3B C(17)-methyltransferase [Cytobacillus sp. IB215665]MDX8367327.1 precorrin-3B C(17)-methyltransferase [Cytobacillus sp. IB215665]
MKGKLLIVGFGPGSEKHITNRAKEAIAESDCVIGYKTYVDLILDLITDQEIVSTGMSEEVSRAQAAVKLAEEGKYVAVISSGDAGVYGMAGLVYEVLIEKGWSELEGVEVEVVPGISAINSCASLLGAPVMHDACTISLSDHLTPWELIERRIEAAGQADFVIALYNPKSGKRTRQIVVAQQILLKYRSPDTPVGLVKSAYRDRQHVVMTTLQDMLDHDIGMLTTVIIGNSTTFMYDNKMITPRGYQRKYTLQTQEQKLKPHERLKRENEPWALHGGKEESPSALDMANKAIAMVDQDKGVTNERSTYAGTNIESIFEVAVSPGVVNKKFTPQQMLVLADVVGDKGTMEYTINHQILLHIPTTSPETVTNKLTDVGFLLAPVGDVATMKACDFCDGEKFDSISQAEEIQALIGGIDVPKELHIGFNGCAMACYGAVNDDIGIVFRKGKFDLFLGAKTVGRTAHAGQLVAEGIEPERLVPLIQNIVGEYKEKGHPNERFHKYYKRVKEIQGYQYKDVSPNLSIEPVPCAD